MMYIYANIFLSSSMYEKIRLICRPWKKPEGSLNRPMLKLLLESHLTYIMTNPGVSEADIIRKFSPHLQPIVVKEVIEVCMYIDHLNFQLRENNQNKSTYLPGNSKLYVKVKLRHISLECDINSSRRKVYFCEQSVYLSLL